MIRQIGVRFTGDNKSLRASSLAVERRLRSVGRTAERELPKVERGSKRAGQGLDKFGKGAANALPVTTELSRTIQDMPFGIQGVGNNIQQLTGNFINFSRNAGGSVAALKAVGASLLGPAGILFAVSAVTAAWTAYGDELFKTVSLNKKVAESSKDVVGAALGEAAALKNLVGIASDESLAKKTRLGAMREINKEYGEYLGNLDLEDLKTSAVKSSIDALTRSIIKNAQARGVQQALEKALVESSGEFVELSLKRKEAAKAVKAEIDRLIASNAAFNKVAKDVGPVEQIRQIEAIINRAGGSGSGQVRLLGALIGDFNQADADLKKFRRNLETQLGPLTELLGQQTADRLFNTFEKINEVIVTGTKKTSQAAGAVNARQTTNPLDAIFAVDQGLLTSRANLLAQFVQGSINSIGNAAIQSTNDNLERLLDPLLVFQEASAGIIQNGIVNTFAGIGEAIGASLTEGANLGNQLGAALLSSIGNVAVQLGQVAIGIGVGIEAIKKSLISLQGPLAIGAGVALIALGSVFKKASQNLAGSFGGGGSSGGFSTGGGVSSSVTNGSFSGVSSSGVNTVVFEIGGDKLFGVLKNYAGRVGRQGGKIIIG